MSPFFVRTAQASHRSKVPAKLLRALPSAAYYRGAMGILLVYDVTDDASFTNIRNWMRNIEQHASDSVNKARPLLAAYIAATERGSAGPSLVAPPSVAECEEGRTQGLPPCLVYYFTIYFTIYRHT